MYSSNLIDYFNETFHPYINRRKYDNHFELIYPQIHYSVDGEYPVWSLVWVTVSVQKKFKDIINDLDKFKDDTKESKMKVAAEARAKFLPKVA